MHNEHEADSLDPALRQRLLERIQRIPVVAAMGIRIERMAPGRCEAVVPHDRRYDGIYESFHGGLLMTAADSVACFAIMTRTGPDEVLTTTDMHIRFLHPCIGDVTVRAEVIKLGKTLCPVAVNLFDGKGTRVAVAEVTYIRLPQMPSRSRA